MRAEETSNSGRVESTFNVTDALRAEAKKAHAEGTRRGFLARAGMAAGLVVGGASVAQAGKPRTTKLGSKTGSAAGGVSADAKKPYTLPNLYPGWNGKNFGQIQTDENAHVRFLMSALGSNARPTPTFQNLLQPDQLTFAVTSFAFENTGVAAYLGAAPIINSKAYLAAAGSILTIEARHSGFLGTLLNATPDLAGQSFDGPAPLSVILGNAMPYVASLNGGPPLSFDTTPSDANDIAILNFALALELLEQAYYNINVPHFFGT